MCQTVSACCKADRTSKDIGELDLVAGTALEESHVRKLIADLHILSMRPSSMCGKIRSLENSSTKLACDRHSANDMPGTLLTWTAQHSRHTQAHDRTISWWSCAAVIWPGGTGSRDARVMLIWRDRDCRL